MSAQVSVVSQSGRAVVQAAADGVQRILYTLRQVQAGMSASGSLYRLRCLRPELSAEIAEDLRDTDGGRGVD